MNYTELTKDVKFWVSGDSTATIDFSDADIVRSVNLYYDEIVSVIMKSCGRWEWDDNNYDTLPIAVTDLKSGQEDYEIDAAEFLNLLRLDMKDPSGNKIQLEPMSQEDKRGTAMTEWAKTAGTPHHYDKIGNSFILYPTPNYSSDEGLQVYFQRIPDYFAAEDTTKTPGFNPLYHRYLSLGAAVDYCSVNNMPDRLNILIPKMEEIKANIQNDYSKRSRDEHLRASTYKESYRPE